MNSLYAPNESRYSSPLGLRDRVRPPENRLDPVPFLDLFCIGLLFALLSTKIIFTPGVAIDLPSAEAAQARGLTSSHVLTISGEQFLFDGGIYDLDNLPAAFIEAVEPGTGAVLLVKTERELSLQAFSRLSQTARKAGFERIILATALEEPPAPEFQGAGQPLEGF